MIDEDLMPERDSKAIKQIILYSTLCAAYQSLLYMLQISSENLHKVDVLETPCLLP